MSKDISGRPGDGAPEAGSLQYLTFTLGDEVFAMDIRTVREIIQYGAITVVPLMPQFVRGVINLRGAVVPVIDLQVRFARARAGIGKKTCIIIFDSSLDGEKVELGLMVDSVSEVIEIPGRNIEPPPQFGSTIQREFISGMGKVEGRFVVIIEPDRALNVEEMALLAEQGQTA
jgi:purine-binding chemotaxis protein CheW